MYIFWFRPEHAIWASLPDNRVIFITTSGTDRTAENCVATQQWDTRSTGSKLDKEKIGGHVRAKEDFRGFFASLQSAKRNSFTFPRAPEEEE